MKIDRQSSRETISPVKPVSREPEGIQPPLSNRPVGSRQRTANALIISAFLVCSSAAATDLKTPPSRPSASDSVSQTTELQESAATFPPQENSQRDAVLLLQRVLTQLVAGPAFDAKVRETVWTTGREVVGVGTYEQAGGSTGRFNLQLTMHDGTGKHRLQQISDGRLAWTRTDISGRVSLRRVDVGRLDEWVRGTTESTTIAPRLKVGAWAEMLSTIERDYILQVVGASLKGTPVWVITGTLRQSRRNAILAESGRKDWPMLFPTRVRIAVNSKPDSETNFGELLPVRMEYWSDPVANESNDQQPTANGSGRLITLIELYSIRPISPPPAERFRFENRDAEVNFINETDRYIERHGIHLTERERRQLRR